MPVLNAVTIGAVAREKGVSRAAVSAAVGRGTLNAHRQGRTVLIIRDKALAAYLTRAPRPGVAATGNE